jgi:hypothetical protein
MPRPISPCRCARCCRARRAFAVLLDRPRAVVPVPPPVVLAHAQKIAAAAPPREVRRGE